MNTATVGLLGRQSGFYESISMTASWGTPSLDSMSFVSSSTSRSVSRYTSKRRIEVFRDYEVEVSINSRRKKPHKFDWGSDALLIECKAYNWTIGGNSPSAKLSTANEALLYFIAAPKSYRKMLFMPETEKAGKRNPATLVEHYVRRYGHFIPDDVEVYELNESNLAARRVWTDSRQ